MRRNETIVKRAVTRGNHAIDEDTLGSTVSSKYFPVYLFMDEKRYITPIVKLLISDLYYYFKQVPTLPENFSYSNLLKCLYQEIEGKVFQPTYKGEYYTVKAGRGYIYNEEDEPLLMLCKRSPEAVENSGSFKSSDLILLLSTEFVTNPQYSNLYNRLEKEYIFHFYNMGIDVLTISSEKIESLVFNFKLKYNVFDVENFRSEMENYTLRDRYSEFHSVLDKIENEEYEEDSFFQPLPTEVIEQIVEEEEEQQEGWMSEWEPFFDESNFTSQ